MRTHSSSLVVAALGMALALAACQKPPALAGAFHGEAKAKIVILHAGRILPTQQATHPDVRVSIRKTGGEDNLPSFAMTIDGAPFKTPCQLKADGTPTSGVFTADACDVKTDNYDGVVSVSGAANIDPAGELVMLLGGDAVAKANASAGIDAGDEVHFHFDYRGKR
jgi:hypothetical protein